MTILLKILKRLDLKYNKQKEDYLYHCAGCKSPDIDYPNKEIRCEHSGEWYVPRCKPLEYHMWARIDAYGIYTGLYCEECYENNYPYKKDRYFDEAYCGERIEADY